MASKIVYLEVLDDAALDNMLAFIGSLIRNKYNTHKIDTTIGFAIQARGVQKIEFVARRTDFKEIEDGSPDVSTTQGVVTATPGNEQITSSLDRATSEETTSDGAGTKPSSVSDADPGDSQPDTDSGC